MRGLRVREHFIPYLEFVLFASVIAAHAHSVFIESSTAEKEKRKKREKELEEGTHLQTRRKIYIDRNKDRVRINK